MITFILARSLSSTQGLSNGMNITLNGCLFFLFQDELAGVMALTWLIVQHFLFGLIGSAVNISHIQSKTAGTSI